MAIDPTAPVPTMTPGPAAGGASDSVAVIQALARQALVNATAELGEIVGRPAASPQNGLKPGAAVAEAHEVSPRDPRQAAEGSEARTVSTTARPSAPAAPEAVAARVVRQAVLEAVPRQTGLAPLMADARAAVARSDTPPEVREAARALLAATPTTAQISTPRGLRLAVERSGVFLEARLARAPATAPPGAPPPVSGDMKAALLVFRGVLSAWLAKAPSPVSDGPTVHDIPAPPAEPGAEGPPDGRPRIEPAAAAPPSGSRAPTPASTAAPLAKPTPAPIAEPQTAHAEAQPPSVAAKPIGPSGPPDSRVPETGPSPSDDEALALRFGPFVSSPKPVRPSTVRTTPLSGLAQVGLIAEEALADESLSDTRAAEAPSDLKPLLPRGYGLAQPDVARAKVLPPPFAGGPMAGQRPAAPQLPADPSPAELVRRLLKGTDGAVARQDLMQIASLPRPSEAAAAEARQPPASRLTFDMPFATPQGVAVAQFEIGVDSEGGGGGGGVASAELTYKARFSIDIEPLGPVHALVALTGTRARVSLWAERAETIARLRDDEAILGAALREAELSPEVSVHSGAPFSAGGASPLGHFVDQAS